jgi:ATPase subunit of ABC transporter with duplicated ATPase domains
MLVLQNITYIHSNKDVLFTNIYLTLNKHEHIALIGNNGVGKSTLLQLMAGQLEPCEGSIVSDFTPYYIPQITGQFNVCTIAEALQVNDKLDALKCILAGEGTEEQLNILADDWVIEERCLEALRYWGLEKFDFTQKMETLSGGEKTKVFLAGIMIHKPDIILMDEPSNHLDIESREKLYAFIESTSSALAIVSHDRMLLNLLNTICELHKDGITVYGGNYGFYTEQKRIENTALNLDIKNKERTLRKAKEVERETMERQQKLDARGKKKQEKSGLPTISMKTFKNNAEKSTARTKDIHAEKIQSVSTELSQLRNELPDADKMKFCFDQSGLHKGKVLISAKGINVCFEAQLLWKDAVNVELLSGERVVVKGRNGSGKTTLVKILLGEMQPYAGTVKTIIGKAIYIDQEYSLINNSMNVYEQAQAFNDTGLQEHEIKTRLNRFLFTKNYWDKTCSALSGGEKMRLLLCCLTILNQAPDIIVLDEPTNNLDIQNIEILTQAINAYEGSLLVISHDIYFMEQIRVERTIELI